VEVIEKHGVTMKIYTTKADCDNAAVLYQETETGHSEDFTKKVISFTIFLKGKVPG
jgi:hypothetical protein